MRYKATPVQIRIDEINQRLKIAVDEKEIIRLKRELEALINK
jgi:hypothetical protein